MNKTPKPEKKKKKWAHPKWKLEDGNPRGNLGYRCSDNHRWSLTRNRDY